MKNDKKFKETVKKHLKEDIKDATKSIKDDKKLTKKASEGKYGK